MEILKLALALEKKRTSVRFGWRHFCKEHGQIVDKYHINECGKLPQNPPVSDIVKPFKDLNSIWDLEPNELSKVFDQLKDL